MICLLIETSELTSNPIFGHFKAYKGGLCKYELETTNIFLCKIICTIDIWILNKPNTIDH